MIPTNNQRLRELVRASGLTQVKALAVFNEGLGVAAYSLSAWKGFLCNPETKRYRPLSDALLQHAEKAFGANSLSRKRQTVRRSDQ